MKVVTVLPWHYMISLHSIFCKVDADNNKLFVLLEPHSSFRFQYRLLAVTTFFEIAVNTYCKVAVAMFSKKWSMVKLCVNRVMDALGKL